MPQPETRILEHSSPEFRWTHGRPTGAHAYLWPALRRQIAARSWPDRRAFDLGCGNGATAHMLSELGFDVVGIDLSSTGIAVARAAYPHVRCEVGSVYDDLRAAYGTFPLVVSLEVIEHCFDPKGFARTFLDLIAPGGIGVLSCPYHGYLKNVALAVSGRMDRHFDALKPCGHIKFFSIATLRQLLTEAGAGDIKILRVGRIPPLAKSMVAVVGT